MPIVVENFSRFLALVAVLSRVRDSIGNKANNATDAERGFLGPLQRLLDGLFDALSCRRGAIELGEYSAQFREEIAFYSGILAGVDWQWRTHSHLQPEEYNNFIRTLTEFVSAYRAECKSDCSRHNLKL